MQTNTKTNTHANHLLVPVATAVIAFLVSCILVFTTTPVSAFAVTSAQKRAEAKAALASLNDLQAKLDAVGSVYFGALEEKEAAEKKMAETQAAMDAAQAEIEGLQERLSTRVRAKYMSGSASFVEVLLGATSFKEFATTWEMINRISERDAALVQDLKDTREALAVQKQEYEAAAKTAEEKAKSVESAYKEAAALEAAQRAVYNRLDAEADALLRQERAAQEAAEIRARGEAFVDAAGGSIGNAVVAAARSRLGCPYVWATAGPNTFDCSGLVYWCYRQAGITLSRASSYYTRFPKTSNPAPGDVCVQPGGGHVGIYIGGGQMIHAPQTGDVVKIRSVPSNMYIVHPY